jgi:hypothetical protein
MCFTCLISETKCSGIKQGSHPNFRTFKFSVTDLLNIGNCVFMFISYNRFNEIYALNVCFQSS